MKRRDFLRDSALGLAASTLVGFRRKALPAMSRPNIVYVFADQWRACATGYAGDPDVKTPNLDTLAAESVNFVNAVSVCPVCTPYRASLLTGRYPTTTGMFLNDLYLPDEEVCMGEIFKESGYKTGYIGKWHVDGHGRTAFIPPERRQGFDYWKVAECEHDYNHSHYYSGNSSEMLYWEGYDAFAQTRDAKQYIHDHAKGERPFLLVLSYGSPHFPHDQAPGEYQALYPPDTLKLRPNIPNEMMSRARKEAQGHYGHCSALDHCIGQLLEALEKAGVADDTIFVFTSDHGEMLGSQGQAPNTKQRPWDESVCVPFLLRYPTVTGPRGRKVTTPLNTPDILPTLLALAGIRIPVSVEGEDLSGLVFHRAGQKDRAALIMNVSPFHDYHEGREYRGVRTARYTYVRSLEGPWLLYDNQDDPYQMTNLVNEREHASLRKDLEAMLQSELSKCGDTFMPRQRYLEKWGYSVTEVGNIPYSGQAGYQRVQSPARHM